jgi:filamentous hemagglutinin family protein
LFSLSPVELTKSSLPMNQPTLRNHLQKFNLGTYFLLSKINIQEPLGLVKKILRWLALVPLTSILIAEPVRSQLIQPVIPASDGTGTVVAPNGNQINITGGQLSGDNANLFHSFTEFGLNADQIANFLSTPGIQNILGRVVGGNPSVINGQIQVTGSNANLFLMNPAGIIFGSNASLNVPGAFTATTANGIGFGSNWFNAAGTNNYANLVGNPGIFSFSMGQPGAIFNAGNLTVGKGQNLTLLAGTVGNIGSVSAPEGQIILSAVPGEKLVRLSQPGSPLSLEIQPLTAGNSQAQNWNLPILSLPRLLTSGGGVNANKLTVNSNGIALSGSGIPVTNGDVVAGNVTAKTALLAANRNLTGVESQLQTTGDLNLLAKDTVQIRDSIANPFIAQVRGKFTLQGNNKVDIFALINPRSILSSGGDMLLRSTNTVGGDARFESGGNFRVEKLDGSLGGLFSPYDPVFEVQGDFSLASYDGASLQIIAGGNVNIRENIRLRNTTLPVFNNQIVVLSDGTSVNVDGINRPTLDIRAGTTRFFGTPTSGTPTGSNINIGSITSTDAPGLIFLTNQYFPNSSLPPASITVGEMNTRSNVVIDSRNNIITSGNITTVGSDIRMIAAGNINTNGGILNAASGYGGGAISINATGDITTNDISTTGNIITFGTSGGNGGNVEVRGRNITTRAINTSTSNSTNSSGSRGGGVTLNAGGDITTDEINSSASNFSNRLSREVKLAARGGTVNIEAGGNISTGNVNSSASYTPTPSPTPPNIIRDSESGSVTIKAGNSINVQDIIAFAFDPTGAKGGLVDLTATTNDVTTGAINAFAFINPPANSPEDTPPIEARGGAVNLTAGRNISFATVNSDAGNLSGNNQNVPIAGGNVNMTANGIVQGTGVLTTGTRISFFNSPTLPAFPANTTIFTRGTTPGSVRIQHNGGAENVPFTVGNSKTNGTAGAIDGGASSRIASGSSFPVLPNGGNATGTPNGITIASVNSPPTLTANQSLNNIQQDKPATFTYADLNPSANDANGDRTSIQIDSITAGTLRKNGVVVVPGTPSAVLSPGDSLELTLPPGFSGDISPFSISAGDGVSFTPRTIGFKVVATPPPPPPPTPTPTPPPPTTLPPEKTNPVEQIPPAVITPPIPIINANLPPKFDSAVEGIDDKFASQFESYLGGGPNNTPRSRRVSLYETQDILRKIEKDTGVKPAIIYVTFTPSGANEKALTQVDSDQLDLIVVTAKGEAFRKAIPTAKRKDVLNIANNLYGRLEDPDEDPEYLQPAQELYQLIIAPLKEELNKRGINNLLFIADEGLRSLPFAALHDGKQFLVENYSVGFTPALSITDTRYVNIRNSQVLAMGASKFEQLNPLPAVPQELSIVANEIWQGKFFLNQNFTLNNLKSIRSSQPFGIIHLATHGDFNEGTTDNSFIQFWDSQLKLSQLGDLGLNNPTVELLVLSACRTAFGNREAELGFGGFAYKAGVKTAIASLWQVSDSGTLGLMTELYKNLKTAPIKAEALRQAQIAMIRGQVGIENGILRTSVRGVSLPPESPEATQKKDLRHPYYWAAFTMIGSPW